MDRLHEVSLGFALFAVAFGLDGQAFAQSHPAPASPASPVVPSPPPAGACSIGIEGGRVIDGVQGRFDLTHLVAIPGHARFTADVAGAPRAFVSVDVATDGTLSTLTRVQPTGRRGRITGAPYVQSGALHTLVLRVDESGHNRFTVNAVTDPEASGPSLAIAERGILPEESVVVMAPGGASPLMAVSGTRTLCPSFDTCTVASHFDYTQRADVGAYDRDPRAGFGVASVRVQPATAQLEYVIQEDCDNDLDGGGEPSGSYCDEALTRRPDAIALAAGTTRSGFVAREGHGLTAAIVDASGMPHTNDVVQPSPSVDIGAPAIAFQGDDLWVVWAQRSARSAPYQLMYTVVPPGNVTPPPPRVIQTGRASAFAPALTVRGTSFVLAWMEGNNATGTVRVASGDLDTMGTRAIQIAGAPVNARDPEIAWNGSEGWISWVEYPPHRLTNGVAHVAPLRCP